MRFANDLDTGHYESEVILFWSLLFCHFKILLIIIFLDFHGAILIN